MTDQPETYCCDAMRADLTATCPEHTREDCPDIFFTYSAPFDEYGLMHPDGISEISIAYCPFCGTKFPPSQRDRWFDELEALGIEDALFNPDIPEAYKTAEWRRGRES